MVVRRFFYWIGLILSTAFLAFVLDKFVPWGWGSLLYVGLGAPAWGIFYSLVFIWLFGLE